MIIIINRRVIYQKQYRVICDSPTFVHATTAWELRQH